MRAQSGSAEADGARGVTRFIVLGDARTGSNMLCDALNSHAEIGVSDLVSSPKPLADIQRFLGVRPTPLTVALRRQNPQPLSELISNFDELRAAFASTPQRAFFEADG